MSYKFSIVSTKPMPSEAWKAALEWHRKQGRVRRLWFRLVCRVRYGSKIRSYKIPAALLKEQP